MTEGKSECSRGADDDNGCTSVASDKDSDGGPVVAAPESTVTVAAWNIHGLASYKHNNLLNYAAVLHLDVLAVCETHLLNAEQLVQWQLAVDQPDSQYCWFGRPAVRDGPYEQGRGSGGIGLLIRRDWCDFCNRMPTCEHPCLLFVRLELPDAPYPIFVGVAYAVPVGSRRESSNRDLLREMAELSAQYQRLGVVLVCGDFNTHIACISSELLSPPHEEEAREDDSQSEVVTTLERTSVDIRPGAMADEIPPAGAAFVDQMDAAGLVVLNGLCAVGDGSRAEATFGARSVIDLILVDAGHWQLMDSVRVQDDARGWVSSDHELIRTCLHYQPVAELLPQLSPSAPRPDNVSFLINSTRYNTATKGNQHHFDEFEQSCK